MGVDAVANEASAAGAEGADERIVAALLERGRLKDGDLARVRRLQEETGGRLLGLLSPLGLLSAPHHAETPSAVLGRPLASARDLPHTPPQAAPPPTLPLP